MHFFKSILQTVLCLTGVFQCLELSCVGWEGGKFEGIDKTSNFLTIMEDYKLPLQLIILGFITLQKFNV